METDGNSHHDPHHGEATFINDNRVGQGRRQISVSTFENCDSSFRMGDDRAADFFSQCGVRVGIREAGTPQKCRLINYKQGCPTEDRPLSTKDRRLSVWHADQMI